MVMKRIFVLSFILLALSLDAVAQNHYRNYKTYPHVSAPLSAVSLVHSDTNIYFFQTNRKEFSVTPINPANLLQAGTPKYATQVQRFMMKGVFEDSNGKCIIFGRKHLTPTTSNPAFAIVDLTSNYIDYYAFPLEFNELVQGCLGYDANGAEIYMFVLDNGQLMAVDLSNGFFGRIVPLSGEHYTDISWDHSNHCFIATGTLASGQTHPGIIVDIFEFDAQDAMAGLASAVNHVIQYFVDNLFINDVAEHQSLHTVLDDNNLLLYRDLRVVKQDVVWLTRIVDYESINYSIAESYFYFIPTQKLYALDMLYDHYHQRLNFLGELIYCTAYNSQIFAQVDPFDLASGMNIKQLGGGFAIPTPCPSMMDASINIYGSYLSMNNLALDPFHPCVPTLIAGADSLSGIGVLTETYDIYDSHECDFPLAIDIKPASPQILPYTLTDSIGEFVTTWVTSLLVDENVAVTTLCEDQGDCPTLRQDSPLTKSLIDSEPYIILENDRQFVCHNFNGNIQFSLYDLLGKTIVSGTTKNGLLNPLPFLHGVFILQATDSKGCQAAKKVFIIP